MSPPPDDTALDTDLQPVVATLVDLSEAELRALIDATYGVPPIAPGLLAWIDGTCDLDLNRRRGFDYPLLPPEAAIDPSEESVSIAAAMAMQATFAQDAGVTGTREVPPIRQ